MTETEILAHYRALAAEIRLQDNVPLPAAASFLAEIRTATKNRPAAAALGAVNWPSRKVRCLLRSRFQQDNWFFQINWL
jgi:hypothetical protein